MPTAGEVPGGNIEDPPIHVDIPSAPSLSTVDQVPAQPSEQVQTTLKVPGDTPDAPSPSTVRRLISYIKALTGFYYYYLIHLFGLLFKINHSFFLFHLHRIEPLQFHPDSLEKAP